MINKPMKKKLYSFPHFPTEPSTDYIPIILSHDWKGDTMITVMALHILIKSLVLSPDVTFTSPGEEKQFYDPILEVLFQNIKW